MVIFTIGLFIKSMISAFLAIILIHLFVGWVLPPIGFFYLTIAYICRYLLEVDIPMKKSEPEEHEK
jgi:hypothetical protein